MLLAERSFWSVHGTGKRSMVEELSASLKNSVHHATGTESALQWTRAAIRRSRRYSARCMRKATSIKVQE